MSAPDQATRSSFNFDGGSPLLNTSNSLNLNFLVAVALLTLGGLADFVLPKPPNLDDLREVFAQIRERRVGGGQTASLA